jgi:hypothetical protein
MAFKGQNECAVQPCTSPCCAGANLYEEHLVPRMRIEHGSSTGVVTAWYVNHPTGRGMVLLNDFALGDLFGGAPRFKGKLEQQGFVKVRNLRTPEEFEAAKTQIAKSPGSWSGPWLTSHPWEPSDQPNAVVLKGGRGKHSKSRPSHNRMRHGDGVEAGLLRDREHSGRRRHIDLLFPGRIRRPHADPDIARAQLCAMGFLPIAICAD